MNEVKGDLSKPDTGGDTQNRQKRIVDQLDAMIENLKISPRSSKFAQDGGGGGGGGQGAGKQRLPAEAELRLLKSLQLVVNGDTKKLDQAEKEKAKLHAVGSRQGDLRDLLDKLLQKSSGGEITLGPEPDRSALLPEEANEDDIENQELDKNLLTDEPDQEPEIRTTKLIGDRMARSRQRLALNDDPGRVTQIIQDRIVKDMDDLIEQARQQQAQTRNSPKNQGQKMSQPGQQDAQANNSQPGQPAKGGANPADRTTAPGGSGNAQDVSKEIEETAAEWGQVSERLRDAVIQQGDDQVIEEYRKLVEDYWRSLSTKSKDR
jgi:hypothetical protein